MAQAGVEGALPVVAPDDPDRLLGIVSLGDLLKARQRLVEEESKRERFFGPGRSAPTPPVDLSMGAGLIERRECPARFTTGYP